MLCVLYCTAVLCFMYEIVLCCTVYCVDGFASWTVTWLVSLRANCLTVHCFMYCVIVLYNSDMYCAVLCFTVLYSGLLLVDS